MLPNVSVAPNRNKLPHYVHLDGSGCTHLLALYWLMVFIHETHVMPSSGKVKTKRHLFSYLVISGSVLPNVSVDPNRNKLPHYVLWSGTPCTHFVQLYWLMVFIHKTHVMPYSGKVKIKVICSHTLLLQVVSAAQCVSCSKQEHITTLRTCVWYWLHSSSGIDGVYSWNSCDTPSNGKVKTKSHLFSCLVLAGSECRLMC